MLNLSSMWVFIYAALTIITWIFFVSMSAKYNKDGQRIFKHELVQSLGVSVLTLIGIALPAVGGVLAFVIKKSSDTTVTGLVAALCLFAIISIITIWVLFALFGKSDGNGILTLNMPRQRKYITAYGLIFGLMMIALQAVAMFFLFEMNLSTTSLQTVHSTSGPLLRKQHVLIDQPRDDVIQHWGMPTEEALGGKLRYEMDGSFVELQFDASDRLRSIVETRWEKN